MRPAGLRCLAHQQVARRRSANLPHRVLTKLVNLWPASHADELMPSAWAALRSSYRRAARHSEAARSSQKSSLYRLANHRRYHESISNLTPADVSFGRGQIILLQRERIKHQTIAQRRLQHQRQAA